MSVGAHMKRVKVHENRFAQYYGLEINHKQRKGTAYDCIVPSSGDKIEFKADLMGAKTGNHFVEFRYSNTEGESWDDSGITLAAEQAQWWVVYFGNEHDEYHWFDPKDIFKYVKEHDCEVKEIRRNLYGNSGKIRCEGWIIPVEDLLQLEQEAPVEPMNVIDMW